MKKISIIIVTYNSIDYIFNCLQSIYACNDILSEDIEIIVVDNSDIIIFNRMKKIISDNFQNIILMHNVANNGYGQGNNIGINKATGNIVCIMNPDVILESAMFKKVVKLFKDNDKLAVVGGKQFGGINLSFWIRPEFEFFLLTTPIMILLNKLNVYKEKLFFLSGALLFLDKEKFKKIGMFDENIFLYREESDIIQRFLEMNFTTHYEKTFKYKHLVDDRVNVGDFSFNEEIKSTKYYMKKYGYSFKFFVFQRKFYSLLMTCFYYFTCQTERYFEMKKNVKRFKSIKP